MVILIQIGKLILNLIYTFYKIRPARRRITFVSRQSNEPSIDIILLKRELEQRYPDVEVRVICRMIDNGILGKVSYLFYMCGPMMKAFAASQVVVLDGYCIPASVLHHRKNLTIVQMWHAMGCFKKFGYAVLGKEEGYEPEIARVMNMHRGYNCVFISNEHCRNNMSIAFGCDPSIMKVMPLPRTDFVRKEKFTIPTANRIYKAYPSLCNKKNILYTPTYRKEGDNLSPILSIIHCIDYNHYNLIIKPHPLMNQKLPEGRAIIDHMFSSLEMLSVADYVISDYSAFILEAALASRPVYLFTPDEEHYLRNRGFFDDPTIECKGFQSNDPVEIMNAIREERTKIESMQRFANKYVEIKEDCTGAIAEYLYQQTN